MFTRIPPSPLHAIERRMRMEVRGTAGSHFKTNVSAPLLDLLLTGAKPLPGARLQVSGPVLRVIRPDGWVEDVGSVLDLKVEGIV